MTKRLEVALLVRAPVAPRDDVIDVSRWHHLVGVEGHRVNAQRMPSEVHAPQSAPARAIAALAGSCTIVIVDAHTLHMTTRTRVAVGLHCARTATITAWT